MHTAQRLHDGASCLWGDEDIGAAVRCRSGPPALRGRGRSRARRHGFRGWARTSEGRGQGPAGDADAPPGTGTGDASRTRTPRGLSSRGLPVASLPHGAPPGPRTPYPWIKSPVLHPYSSRRAERHAGVAPPSMCPTARLWPAGGPLGYGQPVDRPGFEPGNLLLAGELLYQLELAAQRLPGPARGAARTGLTGACPPVSQPASFFGVPLWICQHAGTFTPQGGAPHGRQESNPQPLVLETSALPVELRPYA